jgi:large subunit ribosomal protein L22
MSGPKTNERPGTRAVLHHCRMSAFKARQVLDLIRGVEYDRARDILQYCDREAAEVIGKLLASAAANAEHNDGQAAEELYVSACFADEGSTAKRWRPRARGRATRIRKRSCHITVILSRLPDEEIQRRRARVAAEAADRRARRVAGTRRARRAAEPGAADAAVVEETDEAVSSPDAASTADELHDESPDTATAATGDPEATGDDDAPAAAEGEENEAGAAEADDTAEPAVAPETAAGSAGAAAGKAEVKKDEAKHKAEEED